MEENLDLCIVLPVYNPPKNWINLLSDSLKIIDTIFQDYKINILLVNDGSCIAVEPDFQLLKATFPFIYWHSYEQNQGKGHAIREGLRKSNANQYIYSDWDFPFGEQAVMDIFMLLQNSANDVIVSQRSKTYFDALPPFRRLISKALRAYNHFSFMQKGFDTQAGLKGLSPKARVVFLETKTKGFLCDMEFLKHIVKAKMSIHFMAVTPRTDILFTDFKYKVLKAEFKNLLSITYGSKQ